MASFATQEMTPQEQVAIHYAALDLLSPSGILLYVHQAGIVEGVSQPTAIDNLEHYTDYATHEWRSNLQIVDKLLPIRGLQQMMNFYDNRCRRVHIVNGVGELVVNGQAWPLSDLILNS
jgi:hypothetical protein